MAGTNKINDIILVQSDGTMIFPKTESLCIKRGSSEALAMCTWKDLIGDITPKSTGLGAPTLDNFRGNIRAFRFSAGDDYDCTFHVPHDWVKGSDFYIHTHLGHNGTNISGNSVITYYISHSKRKSAPFGILSAEVTAVQTISTNNNITDWPQYAIRVDDIQISSAGGSASTLDRDAIETDDLIEIHLDFTTIPTITGGSAEPFIFTVDIHYQSTNLGTPNKDPNYYA